MSRMVPKMEYGKEYHGTDEARTCRVQRTKPTISTRWRNTACRAVRFRYRPSKHPSRKPFHISFVNSKTSSLLLCDVAIGSIGIDVRKGLVVRNVVLSDRREMRTPLRADRAEAQIDFLELFRDV